MSYLDLHSNIIRLQPSLYQLAASLTSNSDDAHDLVQDTILNALTSTHSYIDLHNIKDWLFGILRHILDNEYRRESKLGITFAPCEETSQLRMSHHSAIPSPEGTIATNDLKLALESLDEESRMAFSMHLAGYKYVEIAERIGVPVGTIKSRIYNIRVRMQELLSDYRK